MSSYYSLHEFTDAGMDAFQRAFTGGLEEAALDDMDSMLAKPVKGSKQFRPANWQSSKEMAQSILIACNSLPISDLLGRRGLWAWLAFVMRDSLYPRGTDGKRKLGEVHRWLPSNINDYQKGQRHLVRMPVLLLASFGDNADHLLCGIPSVPGEVREQLTSQQDMFHPTIQAVARALYFDDKTGALRRGVSGKKGGSARRFAQVRKQLDVTWDLFAISPKQLLDKLPGEFDRFATAADQSARQSVPPHSDVIPAVQALN